MSSQSYLLRFFRKLLVEMEAFLTGQQMVTALLLGIGALVYQFRKGMLTWALFKENAASVLYPFVWVVCGFGCYYVIKAAIHLHKEMTAEVNAYKPVIAGFQPKPPSRLPGIVTATVCFTFFASVSYLTFKAAFPSEAIAKTEMTKEQFGPIFVLGGIGTGPKQTVWAVVDTSKLIQYRDRYKIFLVYRAADHSIDAGSDDTIEKSAAFGISESGAEIRIDAHSSQAFIKRAKAIGFLTVYAALIPRDINPSEIHSLNDLVLRGGHILMNAGMGIEAGSAPPSGNQPTLTSGPAISVDPYASLDAHSPFDQLFSVENKSAYTIHEVQPRCYIERVATTGADGGYIAERGLIDGNDGSFTLAPGDKTTATCRGIGTTAPFHTLVINIEVPYRLSDTRICKSFKFSGLSAVDKTYVWTYRGSAECSEQAKWDAIRRGVPPPEDHAEKNK